MADIIQDSDQFLVNRLNSVHTVTADNLMATIEDTDLMIINRADTVYTVTGADVKDSLQPTTTIDKPEILAPADGAGLGGDVTYTPKTSEATDVQAVDGSWTLVDPGGNLDLGTRDWVSVVYGDDKYVAVTSDTGGIMMYSSDGDTWIAGSTSANNLQAVTYGDDKFVAVGTNPTGMYSEDGVTWTPTDISLAQVRDICYGGGKFVAVAESSYGGANDYAYSSDGINWSPGSITGGNRWNCITYGNGKYVALNSDNSQRVAYSTDLATWTMASTPSNGNFQSVAYGNGKFVAVASNNPRIIWSEDGATWTQVFLDGQLQNDYYSITFGNGRFVAVAANNWATSVDGINWIGGGDGIGAVWKGVTYGDAVGFVAVADAPGSVTQRVMYSATGGASITELTFADDKAYNGQVPLAWDESFVPPAGDQYSTFTFDGTSVTKNKSVNENSEGITRVLSSFPNTTNKYSFQFGFAEGAAAGDQIGFGLAQEDLETTTAYLGLDRSVGFVLTVDQPSSTYKIQGYYLGTEYEIANDSEGNMLYWSTDTVWRIEYCYPASYQPEGNKADVNLYWKNPGQAEKAVTLFVVNFTGNLYPAFGSTMQSQYNAGTGVITGTGDSPDPTQGTWEGQTLEETFFPGDTVSGVKTGTTTATGTLNSVSGQTMNVTPSGSDPFVEGMVVVRDGTVTIAAPSADDLEFVGSIPVASQAVAEWGVAQWLVSESSDFSSPMVATKAITPGTTQTLLPSERGAIVLEAGKQYWCSVSYSSLVLPATSPSSDAVTFQTGALPEGWFEVVLPAIPGASSAPILTGITYGNGKYVAVGWQKEILISSDAKTWEVASGGPTDPSASLRAVAYGGDRFVVVGASGVSYYSSDAVDWTKGGSLGTGVFGDITYGDGKFVACSGAGTYRVMWSSDGGETWNVTDGSATPPQYNYGAIAYGYWSPTSQAYSVVTSYGNSNPPSWYSQDAVSWYEGSFGGSNLQAWKDITFGECPAGKFLVAIADNSFGGGNWAGISNNGASWNLFNLQYDAYPYDYKGIVSGDGMFITLGGSGKLAYSVNPTGEWQFGDIPDGDWQRACYGGGKFVAIASAPNSSGAQVMYSYKPVSSITRRYYDTNTHREILGSTIARTYGIDPAVNDISCLGFAELTEQPTYSVAGYQATGSRYQPIEDLKPKVEQLERRNNILGNYVAEDVKAEVEQALKEED